MRPRKNPFQPLHFHYMARNGILSSTFRIIIRNGPAARGNFMGIPAVLPRRIISRSPVFFAQRYKPDTKDFSNIERARGKLRRVTDDERNFLKTRVFFNLPQFNLVVTI